MTLIEKGELLDLGTQTVDTANFVSEKVLKTLQKLAITDGPEHLYRAADPGYPSNFSRDGILSALIGGDKDALRAQVVYSAQHQGKKIDPRTGEEPGKPHHELPGVEYNGVSTAYNACDTAALSLLSIARLDQAGDETIIPEIREEVLAQVDYIKRHVRDGLFYEDPKLAGTERFGLRVTYWKDSILNTPEKEEPRYPVVYSLAHFQNADALARIAISLRDIELEYFATNMYRAGFDKLWAGDHFVTAIDADGVIDSPSTDSLYSLLHISPFMLPEDHAERIQEYSRQLETKAGYRTGLPVIGGRDNYHTDYVWTHEQAVIHAVGRKYGLQHVQDVARRVVGYFKPDEEIFPELVSVTTGKPAGNLLQLWSVRAYQYFQNPENALL